MSCLIQTHPTGCHVQSSSGTSYPVPDPPMEIAISSKPIELNSATGSPGRTSIYVELMCRMSLRARRMLQRPRQQQQAAIDVQVQLPVHQHESRDQQGHCPQQQGDIVTCVTKAAGSKHLWNAALGKVRGSRNEPCTLRKRGRSSSA